MDIYSIFKFQHHGNEIFHFKFKISKFKSIYCLYRIRDNCGKQCPFVQKGLRLLVGIPQSPENCPADKLRARQVWHFLLPPFYGNKTC